MGFRGGWHALVRSDEQRPHITLKLFQRVLGYAGAYRGQIAAMLALILVSSGLGLVSPLIMRNLIDYAIPQGDLQRLGLLGLGLVAVPVLHGLISIIQRRLNSAVGEGVICDLRRALYAHLQRMSLRFYTHTKTGELMSRLNNDVIGAQNAISNTIVSMVTNAVQGLAVMLVLLFLEWRLALISLFILPIFFLISRRLAGVLRELSRSQMEANALMNAMMNETLNIGGALLVKLFGRAPQEVERFDQRSRQVRDLGVRRSVVGASFHMFIGLVSAIGMALVYGLGGLLAIRGTFTVGAIVAFGAYLGTLYGALQGLANAPVEFATSMVSFERVFEVLDLPVEIDDQPQAVQLSAARGEIVFENVTFKYDVKEDMLLSQVRRYGVDSVNAALSGGPAQGKGTPGEPAPAEEKPPAPADEDAAVAEESAVHTQARSNALYEVSFHVQPGQLVALVGPSGAGKTTLTYLIPRLYDPTEGRILIDGHDLREVSLTSLTAQIGMVTQETHLFHDTIRTNLLYARLDATQAELEAAAQAANIHDFILGLPDSYDTIVGERGYRLSGGEKQRVSLARVILKNPRILVLDEATSHLDSESEALIQDALKRVMAGRTSIVIAHRLSTVLAADQILVFDRGRIIERGPHADLLALNGLYAQLYRTQFERRVEAS